MWPGAVLQAESRHLGVFWLEGRPLCRPQPGCRQQQGFRGKLFPKKYPVLYLEAYGGLSTQAKCYAFRLSNKIDLHRCEEEIRHFKRLFPSLHELRHLDLKLLSAQQEEIV